MVCVSHIEIQVAFDQIKKSYILPLVHLLEIIVLGVDFNIFWWTRILQNIYKVYNLTISVKKS
jgi:hypothetical protein